MPWSAWAHTVTGMALWETGQADPAIERLKDAVSLAPFDVRIRMHLAECLMDVQRNPEAVRILAPLARLLPQDEAIAEMLEKSQAAVEASRTRVRRPGTGYIRVKPAPK